MGGFAGGPPPYFGFGGSEADDQVLAQDATRHVAAGHELDSAEHLALPTPPRSARTLRTRSASPSS